ncbi:MAG TPA: hypothetical protein VK907_11055, partial [Phnomibacter sp.]|nr:hypothetical protein [Phnomibacter sp.]
IAKRLVKVPYISLVNLIMEKEVVVELIQNNMNSRKLVSELERLLNHEAYRARMKEQYQELRKKLFQGESPSEIAARHVLEEAGTTGARQDTGISSSAT